MGGKEKKKEKWESLKYISHGIWKFFPPRSYFSATVVVQLDSGYFSGPVAQIFPVSFPSPKTLSDPPFLEPPTSCPPLHPNQTGNNRLLFLCEGLLSPSPHKHFLSSSFPADVDGLRHARKLHREWLRGRGRRRGQVSNVRTKMCEQDHPLCC